MGVVPIVVLVLLLEDTKTLLVIVAVGFAGIVNGDSDEADGDKIVLRMAIANDI